MRWLSLEKRSQYKEDAESVWKPWFAWRPVKDESGVYHWLESVERKKYKGRGRRYTPDMYPTESREVVVEYWIYKEIDNVKA